MTEKFSPPPWTWDAVGDLVDAEENPIIEVTPGGELELADDDGRLIAAAPELFVMLNSLLPYAMSDLQRMALEFTETGEGNLTEIHRVRDLLHAARLLMVKLCERPNQPKGKKYETNR